MRFASIVVKVVLLSVVSAIAISCLSSCYSGSVADTDSRSSPSISSSTSVSPSEGFVALDWMEDYSSILGEYRKYVDFIISAGSCKVRQNGTTIPHERRSRSITDGVLIPLCPARSAAS